MTLSPASLSTVPQLYRRPICVGDVLHAPQVKSFRERRRSVNLGGWGHLG